VSPNHWIPNAEHRVTASAIVHRAESDSEDVDFLNEIISSEESKILNADQNHSEIYGDDPEFDTSGRQADLVVSGTNTVAGSVTSSEMTNSTDTGVKSSQTDRTGDRLGIQAGPSEVVRGRGGRGPSPLQKPFREAVKQSIEDKPPQLGNLYSAPFTDEDKIFTKIGVRSEAKEIGNTTLRFSITILV